MKVFVFDLLAYGEQLEHLKIGNELPYPLPKKYFKPEVAARTYAEHLDAWEELDRLGYDGVGFNEHHCSPYGLMNSPNLLAAAAAQRTKSLKLLIYGNLLPLHEPLRLAEELAMLDCMSNGRLISGFARGIPREYQVHNVPLAQSRARFEEAFDIIRKAWTEEIFSYRRRILVLQGCRTVAAAGAAAASADLDADRRQQGVDRVRRPARSADHSRARPLARIARRHHPLLRALPERKPATGSRPTISRSASAPMSPTARPRRCAKWDPTTSISIAPCSATAISPRPSCSARPVIPAPPRPITSAPRTAAPPSSRARISAA